MPSRLIYGPPRPNRYFSKACLGEQLKNRGLMYLFQKNKKGPRRRWLGGEAWLERLNISRVWTTNVLFLLYYLLFIYLTNGFSGSAGKRWLLQHPRPGFESQVCIILHNIFQFRFTCCSTCWGLPYTSRISHPRPSGDQTKGLDLKYTLRLSQLASTLLKKVHKAMINWAWISKSIPLFGDYPPWFAILFIFLIFYF